MILETANKAQPVSAEALAKLAVFHLPPDYPQLNNVSKQAARKSVLTSWFDPRPSRSWELCNNLSNYLAAHRLWVDFYLKPDEWTSPHYHSADPLFKYDILRAVLSNPLSPKEPSKTAITAPRGGTKTTTCFTEAAGMMAICRPNTGIVLSELNKDLTKEKMSHLRQMIEENVIIHRDFGGRGTLFPKGSYGGQRWSDEYLGFSKFNRSFIAGVSVMSKHRGRHPIYGIIDDPDDGEVSKSPDWRKKYFSWLFRSYIPMFRRGGVIIWIQTVTHGRCLVNYAMRKQRDALIDEDDLEPGAEAEVIVERDPRFEDWKAANFALIIKDPITGEYSSQWEDYIDVETFERMKKRGLSEALAEYQGLAITEGTFVFHREKCKHEFMWCKGGEEFDDYFLDLCTGRSMPWKTFLSSLYVVGGGDFADSLSPDSDRASAVITGVDADGVFYVLDAYYRLVRVEELIEMVLTTMMRTWNMDEMGWEKEALQDTIIRTAQRYADALAQDGFEMPRFKKLKSERQKKIRRIIGIVQPALVGYRARFLRHTEFTDQQGVVHVPVAHPRLADYRELLEQVDGYTDMGAIDHDDAIDALHLALRAGWQRRGFREKKEVDPNDRILDEWADLGLTFDKSMIKPEAWTEKMLAEAESQLITAREEFDPYDG